MIAGNLLPKGRHWSPEISYQMDVIYHQRSCIKLVWMGRGFTSQSPMFHSCGDVFLGRTSTKQWRWSVLLKDTTPCAWWDSNPRPLRSRVRYSTNWANGLLLYKSDVNDCWRSCIKGTSLFAENIVSKWCQWWPEIMYQRDVTNSQRSCIKGTSVIARDISKGRQWSPEILYLYQNDVTNSQIFCGHHLVSKGRHWSPEIFIKVASLIGGDLMSKARHWLTKILCHMDVTDRRIY